MSAYTDLENLFRKMSALSGASAILNWDGAVMMTDGGAASRAEQMATLGVISHEMLTDGAVSDLLDAAEVDGDTLDQWQRANLSEMRHEWRHATAVDSRLVEALSLATSACEMTWRSARADNDFSKLQGDLEEVFSLTGQMAASKSEAFGLSPYDVLLDQFEPGCSTAQIDHLFTDLEAFLPEFLQQVLDKQASEPSFERPEGPFEISAQKQLGMDFMADLGFDFNRGRLDTSHHPFTGGTPDDVRLTTRYEDDDFTQSLMGTLHETGHAMYEQNLPAKWRGQPVGNARGMALHESQSLLVEMQLSRSEDFLTYALPKVKQAFNGDGDNWQFDNFRRLYHHVERGLVRVDADEVTYPLHVILRYRLERAMLSGDLAIKDLPGAWSDSMKALVGITPPNDRLGCLQDIHWPGGAVGYFPTYTMGALAAAQFFEKAHDVLPTLSVDIQNGQLSGLMGWLKENVHEKGCLKSTDQVLEEATGSPLNTRAFKAHLTARYLGS
jgi:carboxypeptidase Taq